MNDVVVLSVWRARKTATTHQREHRHIARPYVAIKPAQAGLPCRDRQRLNGAPAESVASRGALADPRAIDAFVEFSEGRER